MGHEYFSSRFQSQNLNQQRSSTIFLPMLCSRPSIIKDVHCLPRYDHKPSSKSNPKSSSDPLSPKISCIGQVKRKNKVVVFPNPHKALTNRTSTSITTINNNHMSNNSQSYSIVKYGKLKKFFSSKNLTGTAGGGGDGGRGHVAKGCCGCECKSGNCGGEISIVDLDPPLPVVKRRPIKAQEVAEAETESLWQRRSRGATLKGLQIQQLYHPTHHLQPTTV